MLHAVHMARWATRLPAGRLLLVILPLLAACDAERSTSPSSPDALDGSAALAPAASAPAAAVSCGAPSSARLVKVSSASALKSALSNAQPGDFIQLANGRYVGRFEAKKAASSQKPITLCGSEDAVLDGGSLSGGYGLYLNGAQHWVFRGFTVTNALKGIMVDYSHNNTLEGLTVHDIADEVLHLRRHSSHNRIVNNHLYRGGRVSYKGEGIYLGSAESNWCNYTSCRPDTVSHNEVRNNLVEDMSAEGIELKEATRNNVIDGNTIRRAGKQQNGGSVSSGGSIATRGGGSTFTNNTIVGCGTSCPTNGIQIYSGGKSGDGDNNTFKSNTIDVQSSGYGISVSSGQTGNMVMCDNVVRNAKKGFSNQKCR